MGDVRFTLGFVSDLKKRDRTADRVAIGRGTSFVRWLPVTGRLNRSQTGINVVDSRPLVNMHIVATQSKSSAFARRFATFMGWTSLSAPKGSARPTDGSCRSRRSKAVSVPPRSSDSCYPPRPGRKNPKGRDRSWQDILLLPFRDGCRCQTCAALLCDRR